ncbi:MAG: prepilin-type N-terminal cleavage/methylation domain-containing protein [Sedimentisphaerales bacterium]|nr:prepilin-type N-terminal cleavage/methylation domain-containing protein [Sedimentisphaerales bacterium]
METKNEAFTLIELLVVIAIIGILLAILIPALNIAKQQATGAICLANLNGLSKAWTLYAEDNEGRIVGGTTGSTASPYYSWVEFASGTASDEKEEKERAIRDGKLFPYAEAVKIYHCPGDKRYLSPSKDSGAYGLEIGGYRSYSIVGGMKGVAESGDWEIIPHVNMATLKSPGSKYVFVEEADGRGDNAGSWVIHPKSRGWVDPFAIWHNERSTLGFGDGHAEKHDWVDQSTIDMSEDQTFYKALYANDSGDDLDYMIRAYPYVRFL